MHKGLDIKLQRHDTVRACMSGIVRFANYNNGGFGNIIIIRHLNGLETYYAHLQKMVVKPNDIVYAGDFIGTGGTTGTKRTGPHLHFECRWKDYPLDPRLFIDYTNFELKSDTLLINPKVLRAKPTPTRKKYYTIKSGDTLYGLAIRYNTSVSLLCQLNGLRKTSTLRINQRIRIK
jgi:murein DD-endopeptidase MepM/ murein hydrolase activator NlpD